MIIEYATWEIETADLDAYLDWMADVTARCRAEDGCLAYDFRVEPRAQHRGSLFQAWQTAEAFASHLTFPAHVEMLAGGKPWKTTRLTIRRWSHADGHEVIER